MIPKVLNIKWHPKPELWVAGAE